ncbi:MAG: AmmeMemoRadiSam system protein B [Rhodocyclales bacterium]|nr:AmmeMemoRadiSam system protein B [Rhodocyclales bacterium]
MNPSLHIRPPAVAGMFYPADAEELAQDVRSYLAAAPVTQTPAPKALIVPHAGYIYSGAVAARAYALLAPARATIRRVVLLGPVHRVPIRGLALPVAEAFATPLGGVRIDAEGAAAALKLPQVSASDVAHNLEHSLEVQLPFLQSVLDDFTLLPFAVGAATPAQVAEVLDLLWGGPETLILISSDLSHFHTYASAQGIDQGTAGEILAFEPSIDHQQACGATPINGLLLTARRRGMKIDLLDLRNSGDTAGDRARVVGYASFALREGKSHAEH